MLSYIKEIIFFILIEYLFFISTFTWYCMVIYPTTQGSIFYYKKTDLKSWR